ncbi:MAG TPA: hypothetical protein ENJ95_13030 [Bacteroidetes bacterium]|nr:hypothetical protein [Bacteroidota bacterium]
MLTAEIKNDLHRMVVETDDINVLQKIKVIFDTLIKGDEKTDWWDIISEQEKISIKRGLQQLENGKRFPHAEVRKQINELLKK